MPIRWSAVKVSEAMDEVERLIEKAEIPLKLAKQEVRCTLKLPNLPQYIDQRLNRLIDRIEKIDTVKSVLQSVRDDLPQADLKQQQKQSEYGSQQSLV